MQKPSKSVNSQVLELKFHLPPGSRVAVEAAPAFAGAKPRQRHEVTRYFDTPDHLLDRIGLTLGVRRSGVIHTQTVNFRTSHHGIVTNRGEWEWRSGQDKPDLFRLANTQALAAVAPVIKNKLEPVFETDIWRTTRLLHLEENTIVEAAIDQGSMKAGSARESVSELELKLKAGCIGPAYRLAANLQTLAPMWILPERNSARGWYLRTGQTEGGQIAQMLKLRRTMEAAVAFETILSGILGHLIANIGAALRGDTEALHQMRIAIRESRAVLQLFERHLDAGAVARFNAGLRSFGEIFGAARDWDVFCLETLPAAMADLPTQRLEDLKLVAEVERESAHEAVAEVERGHDLTAIVLALAVWAEAGAAQPSTLGDDRMGTTLGSLAPSLFDRAADRVKHRARHVSGLSVAKRHGLRKSLRKLRFDVEFLAGLYDRNAVKIYRRHCQALEKILGTLNDSIVAKRLALSLVTASRPDLAKPAAALMRWNARRDRKALQRLKPALKDWRTSPAFWS